MKKSMQPCEERFQALEPKKRKDLPNNSSYDILYLNIIDTLLTFMNFKSEGEWVHKSSYFQDSFKPPFLTALTIVQITNKLVEDTPCRKEKGRF